MVKDMFNWYESGIPTSKIRHRLITGGYPQKRENITKHGWSQALIIRLLRAKDYIGIATWQFEDGEKYEIDIPQIISIEQWKRVQKKIDQNKDNSPRNTKLVYMLQDLIYCGECQGKCFCKDGGKYTYATLADGTKKRYRRNKTLRHYTCNIASKNPHENHPQPYNFDVNTLDDSIWQYLVENAITHPELIFKQVENRQSELKNQGDNLDSEINKLKRQLAQTEQEKLNYARQVARGKITEAIFDTLISESEETEESLQAELGHLTDLRDNALKIQDSINYAQTLIESFQARIPKINQTRDQLKAMSEDDREAIMRKRQKIVRALCDKIWIYANGKIDIEGLIDGATNSDFGEQSTSTTNPPQNG